MLNVESTPKKEFKGSTGLPLEADTLNRNCGNSYLSAPSVTSEPEINMPPALDAPKLPKLPDTKVSLVVSELVSSNDLN